MQVARSATAETIFNAVLHYRKETQTRLKNLLVEERALEHARARLCIGLLILPKWKVSGCTLRLPASLMNMIMEFAGRTAVSTIIVVSLYA